VGEFKTFSEILAMVDKFDLSLAAVQGNPAGQIEKTVGKSPQTKRILLLVGPESGLSDDEILAAGHAGFLPVSLGPRRLRAETAAIVFPTLVLSYLGDL
jgi:16S rRNA (uracil1498-N3)-methyltransferase